MIGLAALILATLFTGAALYINLVEHPARMNLPPMQARAQWLPAYERGYLMQASLAVLSGIAGLAVWWRWSLLPPLAGGLLMLANWPWTLFIIMPVNRRLKAAGKGDDIVGLLSRWNSLHAVRTALGFAAVACFLIPLLKR